MPARLPAVELRLDGPATGEQNMAADERLLREATAPIMRLYSWQPSTLSLGRFQAEDDIPASVPAGTPTVRRASGGGAIYHHDELTFGLVLPYADAPWASNPHKLYAVVNRLWIDVLASLGVEAQERPGSGDSTTFVCFDRQERTDLVVGDKKILGSAQRRTADAVLIHGSLPLGPNPVATKAISVSEALGRRVEWEAVAEALRAAIPAAD